MAAGEKGSRTDDWACARVVEHRDGAPGPEVWLLARRSLSNPTDLASYLSNAPAKTGVRPLAQVVFSRHAIEQVFEEAKGETGLDEYEGRYWHSWYCHITLPMMAYARLVSIRCKAAEKGDCSDAARNAVSSRSNTLNPFRPKCASISIG